MITPRRRPRAPAPTSRERRATGAAVRAVTREAADKGRPPELAPRSSNAPSQAAPPSAIATAMPTISDPATATIDAFVDLDILTDELARSVTEHPASIAHRRS